MDRRRVCVAALRVARDMDGVELVGVRRRVVGSVQTGGRTPCHRLNASVATELAALTATMIAATDRTRVIRATVLDRYTRTATS